MVAVSGTGAWTLLTALITEKSINTFPLTVSVESATVSILTVWVALIYTGVAVKAPFTTGGAGPSISVTRSVAARTTVLGTKITVEASGAVGCTTSTYSFAPVIETARLTSFVALFSVKSNCA